MDGYPRGDLSETVQAPLLEGVWAALPTTFDDGGRVDQKALDHLLDYLVPRDLAGFALLTEAGEDPVLAPEERRQLIASIGGRRKGAKPVLLATSAPPTREAVGLAKRSQPQGACAPLRPPSPLPGLVH